MVPQAGSSLVQALEEVGSLVQVQATRADLVDAQEVKLSRCCKSVTFLTSLCM